MMDIANRKSGPIAVDPEHSVVARALRSLRRLGIDGEVLGVPTRSDPEGPDAVIELRREGRVHAFQVVVKNAVRPSMVASIVDQLRAAESLHPYPTLLVAEFVSPITADLLRSRHIQFADASGNAFIGTPDLLVAVEGRRPMLDAPRHRVAETIGPAALQVMFVLLRDDDAMNLSVRDLGVRAGVSHGAAAAALKAFDGRGWIRRLGRTQHQLANAEGLIASWLQGFADRLAPRLEIARATSPGIASPTGWARAVVDRCSPADGLLGGEGAAEILGYDLRGSTASVYVQAWDSSTMKRLRLVPARDGAISVRTAFAPRIEDARDDRLVDPLILLAEISAIPDERLDETRSALRQVVVTRLRR